MAVNPGRFIQEVRREAAKIHWPTRSETLLTTLMVFVMAALAATLFFLVDSLLGFGVNQILHLGR